MQKLLKSCLITFPIVNYKLIPNDKDYVAQHLENLFIFTLLFCPNYTLQF